MSGPFPPSIRVFAPEGVEKWAITWQRKYMMTPDAQEQWTVFPRGEVNWPYRAGGVASRRDPLNWEIFNDPNIPGNYF